MPHPLDGSQHWPRPGSAVYTDCIRARSGKPGRQRPWIRAVSCRAAVVDRHTRDNQGSGRPACGYGCPHGKKQLHGVPKRLQQESIHPCLHERVALIPEGRFDSRVLTLRDVPKEESGRAHRSRYERSSWLCLASGQRHAGSIKFPNSCFEAMGFQAIHVCTKGVRRQHMTATAREAVMDGLHNSRLTHV
jgi:hypothetical protein